MKTKASSILKKILMTTIASMFGTPANAEEIQVKIPKDDLNDMDAIAGTANRIYRNILRVSHSGEIKVIAKHYAHSSHVSHKSHVSSSGYSGGGGKAAGITAGAIVGSALVGWGTSALIKKIKKNHSSRSERIASYSFDYASRDLAIGTYGNDVNEMVDSLISFGVLNREDVVYYKGTKRYRFTGKVKNAVKKMHRIMGDCTSDDASQGFLIQLRAWPQTKSKYLFALDNTNGSFENDRDALTAVAILLTENGYLKKYNLSKITSKEEKTAIQKAYIKFQKDKGLPVLDYVDENRTYYLRIGK